MDNIITFIFAAITIEGIAYYFKAFFSGGLPKSCYATIFLGSFVAINFSIDMYSYFNMPSMIPFVGNVLTGILLSRGSNYIFDLLGHMSDLPKDKIKKT